MGRGQNSPLDPRDVIAGKIASKPPGPKKKPESGWVKAPSAYVPESSLAPVVSYNYCRRCLHSSKKEAGELCDKPETERFCLGDIVEAKVVDPDWLSKRQEEIAGNMQSTQVNIPRGTLVADHSDISSGNRILGKTGRPRNRSRRVNPEFLYHNNEPQLRFSVGDELIYIRLRDLDVFAIA